MHAVHVAFEIKVDFNGELGSVSESNTYRMR